MKKYHLLALMSLYLFLIHVPVYVLSQVDEFSDKDYLRTGSGLKIKIIFPGEGNIPEKGDQVLVHYTGKLANGTVFDSSIERKKPITFQLGVGKVIKGWDEGIALLRKGGQAKLIIPPELGYGNRDMGSIPPNSTLYFDVNLIDFKKQPEAASKPGIQPFNTEGKDTLRASSGLKYIIVEKGRGEKVEKDRVVKIHYSGYLKNGKMFDSTFKRGEPFKILAGAGKVLKGLDEGIMLMRQGDKFRIIVPPELGFSNRETSVIPANSTLIFDVELLEIAPPIVIEPFNTEGLKRYSTASGLQYYIVKEGNGVSPNAGENVAMHYTGYLQDGTIFDSSVKRDEEFIFPLGEGKVIPGWEEAVSMMKVGDKFRIILPPNLAYGNRAMGAIPANSTLIFDLELLSIKK